MGYHFWLIEFFEFGVQIFLKYKQPGPLFGFGQSSPVYFCCCVCVCVWYISFTVWNVWGHSDHRHSTFNQLLRAKSELPQNHKNPCIGNKPNFIWFESAVWGRSCWKFSKIRNPISRFLFSWKSPTRVSLTYYLREWVLLDPSSFVWVQ